MSRVPIPGGRDVRATLDSSGNGERGTDTPDDPGTDGTDACVVACPPHPRHGGRRSDRRLRAVADALVDRGVACLRFDYGPWDESPGERRDAANALDWAVERYERLGIFGYSFGGAVALVTAADRTDLGAVAALAPAPGLPDGSDAADALNRIEAPTLVVYGERDDTVEWERVVERARAAGHAVESVPADHHFVGQSDVIADAVAPFLADNV